MGFKNTFRLPYLAIPAIFFLGLAIIFGQRGDTFSQAKAILDAEHEGIFLQANYIANFEVNPIAKLLPKIFNNIDSRYFIRYPHDWENNTAGQITILNGKEGTPAYYTSINIQTIRSDKIGGNYTNVGQFVDDLKKLFAQNLSNVKFLEQGPIILDQINGKQVRGEYLIFTYSDRGLAFKQWQVIVMRDDGIAFYVWAFNSPLVHFQNNLDAAQAMLKSWDIY